MGDGREKLWESKDMIVFSGGGTLPDTGEGEVDERKVAPPGDRNIRLGGCGIKGF